MLLTLPKELRGQSNNQASIQSIQKFLPSYLKPEIKKEKPKLKPKTLLNKPSQNAFAWGHCTSFVASKKYITWHGNARDWLTQAKKQKYQTGKKPKVGAVCVENLTYYGHCSLITKVKKNKFLVKETNYCGLNVISERWVLSDSPTIIGLIY